jgi:hypothetical protein
LKWVGSEIISVNREVKRKVIMTPKERKKTEEPGLTQWEEMDKKDQKWGLIGDILVYHQSISLGLTNTLLGTTLFSESTCFIPEDGGNIFLINISSVPQNYTEPQPKISTIAKVIRDFVLYIQEFHIRVYMYI